VVPTALDEIHPAAAAPYDLELGTMHTYFAKRLSKTWGLSVMPWLRYVRASAVPLGVALIG
jgi:hypothetical protein